MIRSRYFAVDWKCVQQAHLVENLESVSCAMMRHSISATFVILANHSLIDGVCVVPQWTGMHCIAAFRMCIARDLK